MPDILIVSAAEAGAEKLSALSAALSGAERTVLRSAKSAKLSAMTGGYDLIVINTPLTDGFGDELARELAADTTAGVLLLVKAEQLERLAPAAEEMGVAVLGKPFSRELFLSAARLCLATRARLQRLLEENRELEVRMAETKIVGRAKCVLIQHLNMTEPQAHRYIEKQAMDMRVPRAEVARGILSAYEF